MDSFATLASLAQGAVQDQSDATLVLLKSDINSAVKLLEGSLRLPPFEKTRDITTTTSASYPFPQDLISPKELYSTVGTVRYPSATKVHDEITWNLIKSSPSVSNIVTHWFARPGSNQIEIWPTPSTAGNTITLVYEAMSIDMSADDYTTGTITTLANAGTAITFSGTTLTAAMVGRWIKLPDNYWYLLSGFTDTTHMAIKQLYQGTAIVAGSSTFTIGEMSRLPIQFQRAPVTYAAWRHYAERKRDLKMAEFYEKEWNTIELKASTYTNKFVSSIVPSVRRMRAEFMFRNPNMYPQDLNS